MKIKNLYCGTFNWHLEIHVVYKHAYSKAAAKALMFVELAKKLDTSVRNVRFYFNGSLDNFKIEKENYRVE